MPAVARRGRRARGGADARIHSHCDASFTGRSSVAAAARHSVRFAFAAPLSIEASVFPSHGGNFNLFPAWKNEINKPATLAEERVFFKVLQQ